MDSISVFTVGIRWNPYLIAVLRIPSLFEQALKTSGFNIEDTHLTDIERIEKLFALVLVAFTWAYLVGDYFHKYIKPIPTKKHGSKAKTLFKYGLTYVATVLLNNLF